MRNPKSNEEMVGLIICGAIALIVLYYFWTYVVGFLALCGAYHLYLEHWKKSKDRNRRY